MAGSTLRKIRSNAHFRALCRPFWHRDEDQISHKNSVTDAYIWNWDEPVSQHNHIHGAQLDFTRAGPRGDH